MQYKTKVIHSSLNDKNGIQGVNMPIHVSSTFIQKGLDKSEEYVYSRSSNPTRKNVETTVASLEGANYTFATASGMAAISLAFGLFKCGDKILISTNVYGGTYRYITEILPTHGVEYELIDDLNRLDFNTIDSNVKGIFVETPSNPLLEITDIKRLTEYTKKNEILVIVDNTFLTSYYQKPLDLGADIVVYSATKYYGGHADLIAGLVVLNNEDLYVQLKLLHNTYGGILSPFDSFLLTRGIKTLPLRLEQQQKNTIEIIEFIENENIADKIYYSGHKENEGYGIQCKQATGFGSVFSICLNKKYDLKKFVESLKIFDLAVSLGGVESLLCHPATMTHESFPKDLQERLGITDNLLRFAIGVEDIQDLINDLKQALDKAIVQ